MLVVIDTLRADAVSSLGGEKKTTPNFDRLSQRGLLYTHAFSVSSWTLPSHVSLFTGQDSTRHRVGLGSRLIAPGDLETLAERMAGDGYETACFSENPLLADRFGVSQGC